jgi:hypothetical protein
MTHIQASNLLTFNTIMLNEKILMSDYIIEKFETLIGKIGDVVIREPFNQDKLDKYLYSYDFFESRGGYTEDNLNIFSTRSFLSIDFNKSKLLNIKEKMLIYYLKSFRTYF